ncbi:hypothetical protein G6F32_015659 [Rhizopus arrhizus]|nr:hypothetical protein G6F32_015659 [Rhizopus arrhizus]
MARQRHRVVQVGRAFGAQRRGRTHRARQHDGFVVLNHQAQEVRGFFKRIRAVGDDDAGHRGVLAQRVHALGQRAPDVVRHVLAAAVGDLLGADLCNAGQLRYRRQQIVDGERTGLVARRGRVRLRPCNGAAGGQHRDDRQRVLRHPRLRTGLGVPAANSGVPHRGSR